ncbi:MAG: hypothetical protein IJ346_02825 [Clostridia bacterium]|nr:hypothetical protein [Clostridia bacterium]
MNNDIEKDLQEVNPEDLNEEPVIAEDEALEEATESAACCHDCCSCAGCGDEAIFEEAYEAPKKKAKIVTPVIIAAVAFALVAAVVFGGIWIYNAFFGTSLKGVWVEQGFEDKGVYFEFDDEGNVYLRGGGISYFGTYETATYDLNKDTELPEIITKISEKEALSGKVNVLKSDFYMFGLYGGEYIYTLGNSDGTKSVSLKFIDTAGSVIEWVFASAKLPELKYDPTVITNASADEAGIKTLEIDKNIIGTWSEADYGTYTFYEDGTANYKTKYQIDQSYQMFYGVTMGYGVDLDFKYTVGDGKIYMGVDYFTGETNDGVMTYYLDGKNLVIDGVGYAKVETK